MAAETREIVSYIETRVIEEIKPLVKDMIQEEMETYRIMKLSENAFARLWENEEDGVWDKY